MRSPSLTRRLQMRSAQRLQSALRSRKLATLCWQAHGSLSTEEETEARSGEVTWLEADRPGPPAQSCGPHETSHHPTGCKFDSANPKPETSTMKTPKVLFLISSMFMTPTCDQTRGTGSLKSRYRGRSWLGLICQPSAAPQSPCPHGGLTLCPHAPDGLCRVFPASFLFAPRKNS